MKVRDVMIQQVIAVSPKTSYEEATRILYGNNVSGAPVVDGHNRILGIISEKDLFRALYPRYEEYMVEPQSYYDQERQEEEIDSLRGEPIEKYMTSPAITVHPDDPVLRAGGLLLAHGLHRLPVTKDGKLVGIVTREDIFRTILERRLFSLYKKVGLDCMTDTSMTELLQKPQIIGTVTHYYGRPGVAVVKFSKDVPLKTHVHFEGETTDFEEDIESMEYDHRPIPIAKPEQEIGVKVDERVRKGDHVFAVV